MYLASTDALTDAPYFRFDNPQFALLDTSDISLIGLSELFYIKAYESERPFYQNLLYVNITFVSENLPGYEQPNEDFSNQCNNFASSAKFPLKLDADLLAFTGNTIQPLVFGEEETGNLLLFLIVTTIDGNYFYYKAYVDSDLDFIWQRKHMMPGVKDVVTSFKAEFFDGVIFVLQGVELNG